METVTSVNIKAYFEPNRIYLRVSQVESSTIYVILIVFFSLDSLDLMIAIQINMLELGLISIISDGIIVSLLFIGYRRYKDLKVHWNFQQPESRISIFRNSRKIHEKASLPFEKIKAFTVSSSVYFQTRYILSIMLTNGKRKNICQSEQEICEDLANRIAEFTKKPLIYRNYYRLSIILVSLVLITLGIMVLFLYYIITLPLFLRYTMLIMFKTIGLISSFRLVYLLQAEYKEKRKFENDLKLKNAKIDYREIHQNLERI